MAFLPIWPAFRGAAALPAGMPLLKRVKTHQDLAPLFSVKQFSREQADFDILCKGNGGV